MIGLYRNRDDRKKNLKAEKIASAEAESIMEKDKKDSVKHGQHIDKTFHLSDYFITNIGNVSDIERKTYRFVELIHGSIKHPPSIDEKAMYAAQNAALNSVCLSRQVGASIVDTHGNIIATGFNDAPSFGGGLYNPSKEYDNRCVFKGGKCYNDEEKRNIKEEIKSKISEHLPQKYLNIETLFKESGKKRSDLLEEITEELYKNTRLSALTEFSRAIHAEMEALISLSRTNSPSSKGCTLYTTTYPCHNCARHIVAAGIVRVVFIEPYEKSMAISLHDDSISERNEDGKVAFESFEGVSPRSFDAFFRRKGTVKDNLGVALEKEESSSLLVTRQFLDRYTDYEKKVAMNIESTLNSFN